MVIRGRISFGSFSAISMYAALVVSESSAVADLVQTLNEERVSISRGANFIRGMSAIPSISPSSEYRSPRAVDLSGGFPVEFRDVWFGYAPEKPVLKGVNFTVYPGKWTLVRGKSGEGKTTLACLLLRLFAPWSGEISAGGTNVRAMGGDVFAGSFSAVHQEPYLLDDTIINNVLLGEKIAAEWMEKAVNSSKLDELVKGLAFGYNTRVGEGGALLSAGQRQRVALARALIRVPKVLVLDEATSALDPETENRIYGAIKENFPLLTVIFVTHRSDAVKFADHVLELRDGKIWEVSGNVA